MPPLSATEQVRCQGSACVMESWQPPTAVKVPLNSVDNHGERSSSRSKKSTRFCKKVEVREVPSLTTLSEEEINATWYTADEFQVIKQTLVTTIRFMTAKKPLEGDLCKRGLEFRTPTGAKTRKANKLKSLRAVWNEQVSQWKSGTADDEAIRRVYLEETKDSCDEAHRMGQSDEKEAQRYLNDVYVVAFNDSGSGHSTFENDEQHDRIRQPRRSSVGPTAA